MTGIEISQISNADLRSIAQQADKNKDGKLKKEEYQIFSQEASKHGASLETIKETLDMNGLQSWYYDVNKISTDGNDDGKISFKEKAKAFAGGLAGGIAKGIAKHPVASVLGIAAAAGVSILTGGAALPYMVALGFAVGGVTVGKGAVKAAKATTDGEAKAAWEGIGTGTAVIGLSALGVKGANKAAAKAGVKSLQGLENESWGVNFIEGIKALPEAAKVSGLNAKGNVLTWTSAIKGDKVIYANSNATRTGLQHTVQNSKIDAYKVDLNGTVDEVLAKNPGLSYDAEAGKFYVQTSWGEKAYITNDNYMVAKYKTGDYNAIDEIGFKPYTDQTSGAPIDIKTLEPGQSVKAAKVGKPVTYKIAKPGTKYMSAEGQHTLQEGSVLRFDEAGRPYQSTAEFMFENTKLTSEQASQLKAVDPVAYELYNNPDGILSKIPADLRKTALPIIEEERQMWKALNSGFEDEEVAGLKFRVVLQGGREVVVKGKLLEKMGVKTIYWWNDYNGADPLIGYTYQGKSYAVPKNLLSNGEIMDVIFEQVTSGNFPEEALFDPKTTYVK